MSGHDRLGEAGFAGVLDAARANAGWAFQGLYRAYAPAIAGYLRMRGDPDPDATTSEVFLGAYRGLATFEGDESAFRSWLFTIAHRRLIDGRRRRAVRPATVALDDALADAVGGDVEQEALADVFDADLLRALASLTDVQREVVLLRVLGELSVAETAAVLGSTEGAVKMAQRRGLEALRRALEEPVTP